MNVESTNQEAPNLEAILAWVEENRPDCFATFKQLVRQDAMLGVMCMAFSAGRTYQHKYPGLNPNHGYHR